MAYLLSCASSDDKIGAGTRDIVPAVEPWQGDLPVDEVGVIEDVAHDVVVVELLRGQHNGYLGVIQLRQDLDEEVLVADHVGVEDHDKLQHKR